MEKLVTMDIDKIYGSRKVFVTGHTGFKGSWLITWLHNLGAIIKGYALAPENTTDLFCAIKGHELCDSVIADVRDKRRVTSEILSFQPDFVFHLAAQPLVRLSYQIPAETFEINAQGSANLLDAVRLLEKPCIVVMVTTDKVYQNQEKSYYYREDDRLGGYDPYSASKACAELMIDSYRNSFFNPSHYSQHQKSISSARAGNVIGGGDWAKDRIIPDIIRALSVDQQVSVRNPNSIRPWQHVLEPLHGYLVLGAHQLLNPTQFADAFNFGPYREDTIKVGQLVEMAIKYWGKGKFVKSSGLDQPHEAGVLQLDITKALSILDWKPLLEAKEAIKWTIDWYYANTVKKEDARTLIYQDITKLTNHD